MKDSTQEQAQVDIYKHFYDSMPKSNAKGRKDAKAAVFACRYGASPELIKQILKIK